MVQYFGLTKPAFQF